MKQFNATYTADFGVTEHKMLVLGTSFTDAFLMAYMKLSNDCIIIDMKEVTNNERT